MTYTTEILEIILLSKHCLLHALDYFWFICIFRLILFFFFHLYPHHDSVGHPISHLSIVTCKVFFVLVFDWVWQLCLRETNFTLFHCEPWSLHCMIVIDWEGLSNFRFPGALELGTCGAGWAKFISFLGNFQLSHSNLTSFFLFYHHPQVPDLMDILAFLIRYNIAPWD